MKIVLTGGGTGGHFYPLIAVAQEINRLAGEKHLVIPQLYFMAPQPYDEGMLYDNHIKFIRIPSGKMRLYFSLLTILDAIALPFGILKAFWSMLMIYPDVVFSKGGYGSLPTLIAAVFYRIPIIIHESDTVPGKVTTFFGKFAYRVAVSYPEAEKYFPKVPVALTGNPIRKEIQTAARDTGKQFFAIDPGVPAILVLGGSQGAQRINDAIVDALPELVKMCYVIHQTGGNNITEITNTAKLVLERSEFKDRYKPLANLKPVDLKMAAGAADVVISRAGSTIFEIASWQLPSIIIPIKISHGDHQRQNAFAYARTGAAHVIEEDNLKPHILVAEVQAMLQNSDLRKTMSTAATTFSKGDAAEKIAQELLAVGLSHETA